MFQVRRTIRSISGFAPRAPRGFYAKITRFLIYSVLPIEFLSGNSQRCLVYVHICTGRDQNYHNKRSINNISCISAILKDLCVPSMQIDPCMINVTGKLCYSVAVLPSSFRSRCTRSSLKNTRNAKFTLFSDSLIKLWAQGETLSAYRPYHIYFAKLVWKAGSTSDSRLISMHASQLAHAASDNQVAFIGNDLGQQHNGFTYPRHL